jgi:ubiquinone/menaquinone biosynthesis C-methylase UbiE
MSYWEREELSKRRTPQHPVITAYVQPKIDMIRHYISITKQTRLLDVGCGNGFFTFYFNEICDTWGVDYSKKMLHMNPVKKTILMDASELSFRDNSFDIVFCHALLHHTDNIDTVISEMRRVSKKYVILLEPNRNNPLMFLFSAITKEERKALKFSLNHLVDRANKNGLHVINSFSYGMIVPNKTPALLLPLTRLFDFKQPLGITNFVIAEKDKS